MCVIASSARTARPSSLDAILYLQSLRHQIVALELPRSQSSGAAAGGPPGYHRARPRVIFQDFVRYNLSAGDNIAVGRIAARNDRERIALAAKRSQADEVIAKLPAGYDQMIGKRFRNGVELSGGEWQKIAIARAYMREAEVLILDEPTAALDARSEFEVFKRFKELSKGKTAILISHRFSSVRMADRILVLADGKVEAAGTHAELISQPGRYSELFELQAAGYR